MKLISPKYKDTVVSFETNEWLPKTFESFVDEIKRIIESCRTESLFLFRGHRKRSWLLESTFTRSFKEKVLGVNAGGKINEDILIAKELHHSMLYLFLFKYGVLARPSEEGEYLASKEDGLDAWFELMKRYQQYPEEDNAFLKGTNIIDWSKSLDIALYFANKKRTGEGAIFICDARATGKTLQRKPMGAILDEMIRKTDKGESLGVPLLFCPKKQFRCERARNQQAFYFAQMDLRYDLEKIWREVEENKKEKIILKVVLPKDTQGAVQRYLDKKGVSDDFVFPD